MFDKLELLALCIGSSCVVYLEINLLDCASDVWLSKLRNDNEVFSPLAHHRKSSHFTKFVIFIAIEIVLPSNNILEFCLTK